MPTLKAESNVPNNEICTAKMNLKLKKNHLMITPESNTTHSKDRW